MQNSFALVFPSIHCLFLQQASQTLQLDEWALQVERILMVFLLLVVVQSHYSDSY